MISKVSWSSTSQPVAVTSSSLPRWRGGAATPDVAPPNGQARRRLRTRAALLGAGRELLVEGRTQASIEEITQRAGVGFGTFYNHFESKEQLFGGALFDVLDRYTDWLRSATGELDDPAEIFAASFRLTGRLAVANPGLLAPLLASGTEVLLVERGLRVSALEDLERGVAEGRFTAMRPDVLLMVVGGALLGLVRLLVTDPGSTSEDVIDDVAAAVLRMLGVSDADATAVVSRPVGDLPDLGTWLGE